MAGSGFGGEDGDEDDDEYEEEDTGDKPLTGKVRLAVLSSMLRKVVRWVCQIVRSAEIIC